FSIVGLIGMSGIIINDSIVLVSTIDEYAEDRALFPAIVDGASDRLRPVMLTTLTTVLGLAPLLYETSSQALFLKPTVITLVYGLGFGMILVLLVVPALMAAQFDITRMMRSLRRAAGFGGRTGAAGVVVSVIAALIAALFAATLGWAIVTGALPGGIWAAKDPVWTGALLFAGGGAALVFAGFVAGGLLLRRR
ncbi:MAG: efflux RND transporter permease subunit, partial [Gemmobacter sp.]|nr:efflux RND transporter permease subunit [Gemmobacter sp.]